VVLAAGLSPAPARLQALRALLSADELEKADKFVFPEHRARSAAARGQLREILGAALSLDPRALRFEYGPKGKPSLVGAPLSFNVTHSGDLALVSLAHVAHGVDLELHRDRGYDDVARRFFAAGEVSRLMALPEAQRGSAFFETWTAKEAFVKATGDGITVLLADFEARWDAPGEGHIELLADQAPGRFWLRALDVGPGASAALVVAGPRLQVRVFRWIA
jgi:4'-phosphopantetheinyl transferase